MHIFDLELLLFHVLMHVFKDPDIIDVKNEVVMFVVVFQ